MITNKENQETRLSFPLYWIQGLSYFQWAFPVDREHLGLATKLSSSLREKECTKVLEKSFEGRCGVMNERLTHQHKGYEKSNSHVEEKMYQRACTHRRKPMPMLV